MPVVIVTGARQTGKTTLVQDLLKDTRRRYITLDRLEILEQARSHPESLVKDPPLTLDEVQREPKLLLSIKRRVDEDRKPGMYVLTGSANLSLMHSVSESLAGRALYLELPPFCPLEWTSPEPDVLGPLDALFAADFHARHWPTSKGDWKSWLLRGGFPPALQLQATEDRDLWFSGYVQTYLERDLRDLANIADLPSFQKLMRFAAQRTGKLLNQSEISRDLDLPQPTGHRYLNLLETGYQITRLPVYATNPVSSLVKAKKLFWNDCGLAAWLAEIQSEDEISKRHDGGQWLEQALFQTLQTWRSLDPIKRRLYYWRNRQGREVDFILEQHGKIVALEVKSADTVGARDAEGLTAFREAMGKKKDLVRSAVLYGGREAREIGADCFALPWGWIFP
jgi:predicted AAA+ superfamily ATPase